MNRMGIKCKEDHGSHSDERSVRMHIPYLFDKHRKWIII